uniref:Beta-lactamase domain protein n=1 Tax=Gloeothece verrucosa (strain PCC 7822) TaxID=497965 RepID=E0UE87_GLOV7|nr:beta-lactamase domain protein [Gloeothece verrucosa PCC 7822]
MNTQLNQSIRKTNIPLPSTIIIIGGGFSGSMVAAHLLQKAKTPMIIKLIDRSPEPGKGIAYATPIKSHLLNVSAGKMSAYADQPDHFMEWLQQQNHPEIQSRSFAPRRLYGEYIQTTLEQALKQAPPYVHFEKITAEVVAIQPLGKGAVVSFESDEHLYGDKIVLATGNFPSNLPPSISHLVKSDRSVKQAWYWEATTNLDPEASVLVIGTGLTMVDMIVALHEQGHRGPIYAVSRHGLLPQRHQAAISSYQRFIDVENAPQTIGRLLRQVRLEVKAAASMGVDWRAVIDSLRPVTQQLWQHLSLEEQKRFLRHLKCYWDIHRHRIAPEIADILESLVQRGQLQVYAARLENASLTESGLEVTLRQRGTEIITHLSVGRLINCTGANGNYRTISHPLISSLQILGLLRPSAIGLGIDTANNGAILDAKGNPSSWLYTLGTSRAGNLWESIAVPELRKQAQDLAQEILQTLPLKTGFKVFVEEQKQNTLIWRQLFDKESSTYTYLIADAHLKIAALVDPVLEQVERDLQILRELGLTLRYCLETHVHADHITGAAKLRTLTECEIIVPQNAGVMGADRFMADDELLLLGEVEIRTIATPGHTNGHNAYLINGTHLLSGDSLLIRGCGRTDFQNGDAGLLYDVVTERLFTLADETFVYPGHDYQGRTVSTIGEEKRCNPRFAGRSRTQFRELMANLNLPYPKRMKEAVPSNELCGALLEPDLDQSAADTSTTSSVDPLVFCGMYI